MGHFSPGVLLLVWAAAADAAPKHDPCACSPAKPGFFRRDALSGDWGGLRDDLHDDGITVAATYAAELFATPGLARDAATYQLQAGWLTVQPDVQLLLLRERTAGIAGVRVTVAL